MNKKELIKLAKREIKEWQKFLKELNYGTYTRRMPRRNEKTKS